MITGSLTIGLMVLTGLVLLLCFAHEWHRSAAARLRATHDAVLRDILRFDKFYGDREEVPDVFAYDRILTRIAERLSR